MAIGKDINDFGHEDHLEIINTLSSTSAIAEGFINEIVSENADGMSIVLRMKDGDVDYGHHIFFSVFFILVTVAMTGVQHYFIRKHLHKRKYL